MNISFKEVKHEEVFQMAKKNKLPENVLIIDLEKGKFSPSFGMRSAVMYSVGATKFSSKDVLKTLVSRWAKIADKINLREKIKEEGFTEIWITTPEGDETLFSDLFKRFLTKYLT